MARPSGIQTINLRLVDKVGLNDASRMMYLKEMSKLFRGVVGQWLRLFPSSQFLVVQPTFQPGDMKDTDLRCFIVDTPAQSVVQRLRAVPLGEGGTTAATTKGTVSEVYDAKFTSGVEMECAVIFHELMHNKLVMGDEMHTDPEVGFGIARSDVDSGGSMGSQKVAPNQANEIAMARALLRPVPQYLGE